MSNMYSNGKIYKIVDNGYTMCYYGSTVQTLSKRLSSHKFDYVRYKTGCRTHLTSVFSIFDTYGVENCKIELVETFPCNSKEELHRKEGQYIKESDCVNKKIAGRTNRERYEDNIDKIRENSKEYRLAHQDKQMQYMKTYYQDNKEALTAINKNTEMNTKSILLNAVNDIENSTKPRLR